jgi:hypothetical protein
MAVPDHPMSALKGTEQARRMMDSVRSHRATKPKDEPVPAAPQAPSGKAPAAKPKAHGQAAYDEIIARHTSQLPKR